MGAEIKEEMVAEIGVEKDGEINSPREWRSVS